MILPVLLFNFLIFTILWNITNGQLSRTQESLTVQIETSIQQNLQSPFLSLEYLKTVYESSGKNRETIQFFINLMMRKNPLYLDVYILSPRGKVLYTMESKESLLGKDYSGYPLFKSFQSEDINRRVESNISSATSDVSYTLAVKSSQGEIFVCVYSLKDLQDLVEKMSIGESARIAVINRERFYLAQTDYDSVTQRLQDRRIDLENERLQIIHDGNRFFAAQWSYLKDFDLYVILYESVEALYLPLAITFTAFLVLFGGLILMMVIFRKTLISHLLTDMDQLALASSQLSHGNYDIALVHSEYYELDLLTQSFDTMKETIQQTFSQLSESKNQLLTLNRYLQDQYEQIKTREDELSTVMESSYDGIIFLNMNFRIKRISTKALALLDIPRTYDELDGIELLPLLAEDVREIERKQLTRAMAELQAGICTLEKNGRILENITIPVRGGEESVKGLIITLRDITEKVRMEERLNRSERLEAVGRLASGVAHDFNNILHVIFGYSGLLKERHHDKTEAMYLEKIDQTAEKAQDLVNQLLSFCRMEKKEKTELTLHDVIQDVSEMLKRLAGIDITLSLDMSCHECRILARKSQMEQILMNLVVNARDAMDNRGTIRIRTYPVTKDTTGYAAIEVRDSGPGIPKEIQNKIFDPFFSTKEPGKGNGLGLATVYGIVEDYGGILELESEPGSGSCFRIFIPLV